MPKIITSTLAWSPELQRYALFDGSTRLDILPESPAWFDWLNQASSFVFLAEQGRYTLRKERKQRGDAYWYAYHHEDKQFAKKHVGKTSDLTLARLEASIIGRARPGPQQPIDPLLAPKLHIPRLPEQLVSRARLLQLLDQQAVGPLTLISAQAGSGKTTLVAEWAVRHRTAVAWVSLEAGDIHLTRFLSYLIAALQKLDPTIGTTSLPSLKSPQPPAWETIVALLTNELAESRVQPLTLVLDDYHLMTADTINSAVAFLLDHLASHLHLIILTRSDPPLPLPRLRGRGHLLELSIDDLRFQSEETEQFLQAMTDHMLAAEDVRLLQERTEGWIAGLPTGCATSLSELLVNVEWRDL
jgi:LuxR family maltose regulon positive regulatory protein